MGSATGIMPLLVPQLGVNDESVTVVRWLVAPGEAVRAGQVVCDLETTKATTEVQAEGEGLILPLAEAGAEVPINRPLALIGKDLAALRREAERFRPAGEERQPRAAGGERVTAKALRLARELGVDLTALLAEKTGIVRERDVAAYHAAARAAPFPSNFGHSGDRANVAVYGAGRGGATMVEAMEAAGFYRPVCFFDDSPNRAATHCDLPVYGGERLTELAAAGVTTVAVAIASARVRLRLLARCRELGLGLATVIHPRAFVSPSAEIGAGSFVKAGAIVETRSRIGEMCIVDNGAIVPHDNRVGDACHLAPGAVLGSSIAIGEASIIGIGASVATGITIGSGCIVSAGTAVTRDVPDGAVVEGVPGRLIGRRRDG